MSDLKISQTAFEAAGKALESSAGSIEGLVLSVTGDLGHPGLKTAANDAATVFTTVRTSLSNALTLESKQVISAAIVFTHIDQALAGNLTGTKN